MSKCQQTMKMHRHEKMIQVINVEKHLLIDFQQTCLTRFANKVLLLVKIVLNFFPIKKFELLCLCWFGTTSNGKSPTRATRVLPINALNQLWTRSTTNMLDITTENKANLPFISKGISVSSLQSSTFYSLCFLFFLLDKCRCREKQEHT